MKYLAIVALLSVLVSCSGASSESVNVAKGALENLTKARTLLKSVNSLEDAMAIEAELSKVAIDYANAVKFLRTAGQTDKQSAAEVTEITVAVSAEYQGMLLELNALQARNAKAAQVLMDELKSFRQR